MKTLENKKFTFEGDTKESSYSDLIKVVAKTSPQGGIDAEEMNKRSRIFTSLKEEKDGVISLEDADFELLKQLVATHKWGMYEENLLDFVNYIKA